MTLSELNSLAPEAAAQELARCCGSKRWAEAMAARRPFRSIDHLEGAADEIWWSLDGSDWLEAFSQHPRIGERATAVGGGGGWAEHEQSGTRGAADETLKVLAQLNREYEKRFGRVFLTLATGKTADEMLAELRQRIDNPRGTELNVAAAEQAKITRLRLEKLLSVQPTRP